MSWLIIIIDTINNSCVNNIEDVYRHAILEVIEGMSSVPLNERGDCKYSQSTSKHKSASVLAQNQQLLDGEALSKQVNEMVSLETMRGYERMSLH